MVFFSLVCQCWPSSAGTLYRYRVGKKEDDTIAAMCVLGLTVGVARSLSLLRRLNNKDFEG
jgi:hypothetical protein